MKTIKFRGILLDNSNTKEQKQWQYGSPVEYCHDNDEKQLYLISRITPTSIYGFPILPDTLGQFTGIYDKDGREVWEGDIVRYRLTDCRYTKNPQYKNLVINYDEKSARFQAGDIYFQNLKSDRLEVIGNIIENPELIEEKN